MTPSQRCIGPFVDILSGFPFDSASFGDSGSMPVVRIRDVVRGNSSTYYSGAVDERYVVQNGDILIGMDGEFNRARWRGGRALLNQRVCRIQSSSRELDDGYLFHMLPRGLKQIEQATPFVTVKHLSVKQIREIEIPMPPIAEQRRIAEILDKVAALRARRHAALARLDTLTQSIFLDMFGNPMTNPKAWPLATLGDVITSASDGPHVSPSYASHGIPFLSTRHIRAGEILWDDLKFISENDAAIHWKKCRPVRGDVIYTKGGTTGLAALVNTDRPFAIWVHLALLKPNPERVDSTWLEAMLNSPYCYRQSQELTRGIANRDLGLTRMVRIKLYRPPLAEQRVFARTIRRIESLRNCYRSALVQLDALFASLQHRAFRGEL